MSVATEIVHTEFTVVAVSKNTNSFGLHGVVLLSESGIGFEVGANSLNVRKVGDKLQVPHHEGSENFTFASFGFEIPRRLPHAAPNLVRRLLKGLRK